MLWTYKHPLHDSCMETYPDKEIVFGFRIVLMRQSKVYFDIQSVLFRFLEINPSLSLVFFSLDEKWCTATINVNVYLHFSSSDSKTDIMLISLALQNSLMSHSCCYERSYTCVCRHSLDFKTGVNSGRVSLLKYPTYHVISCVFPRILLC